ncbi:lasso RiPP family leader peptide-containing protein [Streptomyces luteireticuli]
MEEREPYEPPALQEVGDFTELTHGCTYGYNLEDAGSGPWYCYSAG